MYLYPYAEALFQNIFLLPKLHIMSIHIIMFVKVPYLDPLLTFQGRNAAATCPVPWVVGRTSAGDLYTGFSHWVPDQPM